MFPDYVQVVRVLFRDAEGLSIEEAVRDLQAVSDELRRAYEAGASEQEACNRLLEFVAEC